MTVLRWAGAVVLLLVGLPALLVGLIGLGDPGGQALLCVGLVALVSAVGGVAALISERSAPPEPRLVDLDGERALLLPRSPGPTRVSSLLLLGLGLVALLGVLFTLLHGSWGWSVVLAAVGGYLVWSSALGRDLAGGLWFTPSRVVHDYRGARVELPWDDVTDVVDQSLMPVLVRADRLPAVQRTGPRGRAWNPLRKDGVLAVDTRHLAGGHTLASYVITKALTDPASRGVLGTPESLPPQGARG